MTGLLQGTKWMIIGGAGYIGAHVARAMTQHEAECIVVDNFSTGDATRIPANMRLVREDVLNTAVLSEIAVSEKIDGIVHLPALKDARESQRDPVTYWRNNIAWMGASLEIAKIAGVKYFLLSSSSSVYGNYSADDNGEAAIAPVSAYGRTKVACENMLVDATFAYTFCGASLRYFNVIGAGDFSFSFDYRGKGVVNSFVDALMNDKPLVINGNDLPTKDGTAVRDYIDVRDVAEAHAFAARRLIDAQHACFYAPIDISTGKPVSVLEIAEIVQEITGIKGKIKYGPHLIGDPYEIWMRPKATKYVLGWEPSYSLVQSIYSYWNARLWKPARQ